MKIGINCSLCPDEGRYLQLSSVNHPEHPKGGGGGIIVILKEGLKSGAANIAPKSRVSHRNNIALDPGFLIEPI